MTYFGNFVEVVSWIRDRMNFWHFIPSLSVLWFNYIIIMINRTVSVLVNYERCITANGIHGQKSGGMAHVFHSRNIFWHCSLVKTRKEEKALNIFWAFFILLMGLVMLVKPDLFYYITEAWKSDYSDEPSYLYRVSTKFGGIMFTIAGVLGVIIFTFFR